MPKILISKAFSFLYFYCFVIDKWHNISGEESVRTFFDKKSNSFFNDYIFYGTNGFNINNAVIGSRDGWNLSECRKEFLSDHCPIMAELSLK